MDYTLKIKGSAVDYTFAPRPAHRTKIRLGILSNHFSPQTETFAAIPVFEHLDRTQFELILYTLRITGHPLEQYCQSRADRLVKLPDDLQSQIQAIRTDDLDILLIGSNVTAVTHAVSMLALHRLARIQLTSINSPCSTGMRNMDYYIGGTLSAPVRNMQDQYREKLVNIDGSACVFASPIRIPRRWSIRPEQSGAQRLRQRFLFPAQTFSKSFPNYGRFGQKLLPECRILCCFSIRSIRIGLIPTLKLRLPTT